MDRSPHHASHYRKMYGMLDEGISWSLSDEKGGNAKCTTDVIGMRACHESQSGYRTLFERLDKIDRLVPCVPHLSDRWNRLVPETESTIIIAWWSYDLQWWHGHDDGKLKSLQRNLKNTNQEICWKILEVGHLVERPDDVPEAWDFFGYSLNKA